MTQPTRGDTLRRAIEVCIKPDEASLDQLNTIFTEDATVWSPNLLTTSRDELADVLRYREEAFSDVVIEFNAIDVFGSKGFVEFRISADFTGPFVLDEDVAIEPNGRRLLLGGAVVADFESQQIKALRGYFDDAALLEQMLA